MIVIEGPDASGKSTLASYLSSSLKCPVQRSEGPEQYDGEMLTRLARYAALPESTIFDRHPAVSDLIYAYALNREPKVPPHYIRHFYSRQPLLIYCEPPATPVRHELKPHDTPEHVQGLLENSHRVREAYRTWAVQHAHIVYRIGDSMDRIVHFVTDFEQDMQDFHQKFGLAYEASPRELDRDLLTFRASFMLEELCEYAGIDELTRSLLQSAFKEKLMSEEVDLHDQFDALIDLVYVALGTSYLHGFSFTKGWSIVHRANMAKRRALRETDSKRGSIYDVVKPEGWQPPSLSHLVGQP